MKINFKGKIFLLVLFLHIPGQSKGGGDKHICIFIYILCALISDYLHSVLQITIINILHWLCLQKWQEILIAQRIILYFDRHFFSKSFPWFLCLPLCFLGTYPEALNIFHRALLKGLGAVWATGEGVGIIPNSVDAICRKTFKIVFKYRLLFVLP